MRTDVAVVAADVASAAEKLPLHWPKCTDDRLLRHETSIALYLGARQDRAEPDTAVSTKKQRELARAIKRARYLGLLPYVIQ